MEQFKLSQAPAIILHPERSEIYFIIIIFFLGMISAGSIAGLLCAAPILYSLAVVTVAGHEGEGAALAGHTTPWCRSSPVQQAVPCVRDEQRNISRNTNSLYGELPSRTSLR